MPGLIFVAQGGPFAISSPIWGYICDKKINGKIVVIIGVFLTSIAFLFIGPVSFIPIKTILSLSIAMLSLLGIGVAAQLIARIAISYQSGTDRIFVHKDVSQIIYYFFYKSRYVYIMI